MKIRTWMIPVAILLILGGSIAVAKAIGYWQTEGHGNGTGRGESAVYEQSEQDPETVTGKTTIDGVLNTGADTVALEALIGPWTDTQTTVRETAQANGHTFSEVKDAVGLLMD